jgi:hypothetical protein
MFKNIIMYFIIILFSYKSTFSIEWKSVNSFESIIVPDYYDHIFDLEIINDSTFLAICSPDVKGGLFNVRRTSDKGKTWDVVYHDTIGNINYSPNFSNVVNKSLISCEQGFYLVSNDQGLTWEENQLNEDSTYSFSFQNSKYGILAARKYKEFNTYKFYFSTDSGKKWERLYMPDEYKKNILSIYLFNMNFLIGYHNDPNDNKEPLFLRAVDSLRHWSAFSAPINMLNFCFLDSTHCWGLGTNNDVNDIRQIVYYSDDGCRTWETIRDTNDNSTQLNSVIFADSLNGIALGRPYSLIRTSDGGKTWIMDEIEGFPVELQGKTIINFQIFDLKRYGDQLIGLGKMQVDFIQIVFLFDMSLMSDIKESFSNSFSLHPNPATSQITLSLGEEFILAPEIDIIDYLGKKQTIDYQINSTEITINTSPLSPGVYFLRVRSGEKVEVRKYVVI